MEVVHSPALKSDTKWEEAKFQIGCFFRCWLWDGQQFSDEEEVQIFKFFYFIIIEIIPNLSIRRCSIDKHRVSKKDSNLKDMMAKRQAIQDVEDLVYNSESFGNPTNYTTLQ